ncbi:MAG: IS5/IS1182 family transposase, partial [Methylovulum sp.]|nr:IS5/IS1182 family transposase [Methylovulum sp.]
MSNEESRPKSKWKVTNWPEYDRALVQRGDVTVWLDEEFVRTQWRPAP